MHARRMKTDQYCTFLQQIRKLASTMWNSCLPLARITWPFTSRTSTCKVAGCGSCRETAKWSLKQACPRFRHWATSHTRSIELSNSSLHVLLSRRHCSLSTLLHSVHIGGGYTFHGRPRGGFWCTCCAVFIDDFFCVETKVFTLDKCTFVCQQVR